MYRKLYGKYWQIISTKRIQGLEPLVTDLEKNYAKDICDMVKKRNTVLRNATKSIFEIEMN